MMEHQQYLKKIMLVSFIVLLGILTASPSAYAGNNTSVHEAIESGDLAELIANKVSVDSQDGKGWTALMYAAQAGNQQQVEVLLNAGALPDIGGKLGRTPLELATKVAAGITRQLIKAGADVNIRNAGGIPIIMTAAGEGRKDLVEILMAAGARLDFKDYQGNTIMDWVKRSGNVSLSNFLLPHFKKAVSETHTESGEDFAEDFYADSVHPEWFKTSVLDLGEDLNDALQEGKKGLMVYFGLKRCSYCRAFMENTLAKPDIAKRVQDSFDVVGMDIFSDNEMQDPTGKVHTVKDFVTLKKANYSPTMIFYGKGGRELLKIVGYYPPNKFRQVLDYLEGEHYERETLYVYMKRGKSKHGLVKASIKKDKLFSNDRYNFLRKKKSASRPLLVLFERPNCEACDRFHQRVLTDKPVRRLLERFDTVQLDATDNKTAVLTPAGSRITPKIWHYRMGLNYSPAMVFFDEAGNEITRLDSEVKRWRMEGTLQLILEGSYTKDTQVQRWRRDKAVMFYETSSQQ